MAAIRNGQLEGAYEHYFPPGYTGDCLFCQDLVFTGVYWVSPADVRICSNCVRRGELGKLIGDAARDVADAQIAVEATARKAYRALALQHEQRVRDGTPVRA